MRGIRLATLLGALGLLILAGCAAEVKRADETGRFKGEMQRRLAQMKIDFSAPLSSDRCVAIALRNSLDYRVKRLRETLQDESVRIAFSDFLPNPNASYTVSRRSNRALTAIGGLETQMEDQSQRAFNAQGFVPILDWGATYYAYQNAKDRRVQERLAVERARQTLIRDVRSAYAKLASLERREHLAQVVLLAARELLRTAQSLERAGLGARADTATVEATLAEAALQWSNIRRGVEGARMTLGQLLSFPAGTSFAIESATPPRRPLPAVAQVSQLEENALARRPELFIQDRQQRIAVDTARQQFTRFLPQVDGVGSYTWLSQSGLTNPGFFRFGLSITHSLLNGGKDIWQYRLDRKAVKVEEERTLLLSLGILYEVDLRVLQLYTAYDAVVTSEAVVNAQQEALKQIISRYRLGLESGIDASRTLANTYLARLQLDQIQTDYEVAGYELDAASPPEAVRGAPASAPAKVPQTLPGFRPAPPLDSLRKMLEAVPMIDLRQYPEMQELLGPQAAPQRP